MSIKNVGIGFVVILMLVLFALGQREPKDTAQNLPSLPSFYAADVVSVAIHHSEKTSLEAKKEGEKWLRVSAEKPMLLNALAIEQLLHDLQTMKVKRVASRKTEQFIRFSVNESEVILKDKQGKVLLDLFVGKPATDLMSTYIRVADDKLVMTVNKILTWQVKRTPDAWLDKKDVSLNNSDDIQLILFDCDGTLTDSHGSIALAMQKAFTDHGLAEPDYQDVLAIIGLSLVAAVERLAPESLDEDTKAKVCESYATNYRAMEHGLALYPKVIETLQALDNRGYVMGVVTGKSSSGLIRVMDLFGLHQFFPVWRTADICISKPHPAMALECMTEMGALAKHTSVIGDSCFDIQMANAAGVKAYGVSFGVEPAHALKAEGAVHVFDTFEEILERYPKI